MKNKLFPLLATLALGLSVALSSASAIAADAPTKPAPEKRAADKGSTKPYPLDVCLVTDNDLGSMGDERTFVYEGQEIKICCKPCERKFLKNPAKYLEKLAPPAK